MNLVCASETQIGGIASAFYFGWMISSLILPTYSDRYGRRLVVLCCCVVSLICYIGLMICEQLIVAYVLLGTLGFAASGMFVISWIYTMELLVPEW